MRSKLLAVLCLLLLVSAVSATTSTLGNIQQAYSRGEIEFTDFAMYKLYLVFGDADRIPAQYAGDRDLPEGYTSGTTLLWDAQECLWNGLFDEAQQADAELYLLAIRNTDISNEYGLVRGFPSGSGEIYHYDTPEGNFRMWWCESGVHALEDYTDTDGDGVPDVVEDVAVGLEEAFAIYLNELKFNDPIHDGTWVVEYLEEHDLDYEYDYGYVDGDTEADWERWDCYFRDLQSAPDNSSSGVMAYCSMDFNIDYEGPQDPNNWNNTCFHMVFDNQAMGSGGQVAKDTAAHELHHGVQYGIEMAADRDASASGHAFEKTSVWAEDKAYPYSNAYIDGRLSGFFGKPHIGLRGLNAWGGTDGGNLWMYDTVIWSHFIESLAIHHTGVASLMTQKNQVNGMTMLWEDYFTRHADGTTWNWIEAHAEMWKDANPTVNFAEPRGAFGALYQEFVRWNWFTGTRKATGGASSNNFGYYYIDDNNTYDSRDTSPVAYPMVSHAPATSREYTGTNISAGYYIEEQLTGNNTRYCPDGLGAVYAHAIDLNDLASGDDVVYAFRGDPANADDTRVWDGLYILMDSATVQDSSQTTSEASMDMHIFGDRGIIRINDASQYHELGLIPFIPVEVGKANSIAQRIWVDAGEDHTAPSFDSNGGALTAGIRPGFGAHVEFVATPDEPLFACPAYTITLTTVATDTVPSETYVYEVSGVNPLESWRFGSGTPWDNSDPQVYSATWNYPLTLNGTADVVMTACDAVGNVGTTTFDDFISMARSGEETVVVGVNANASLELPGNALDPGTTVTIMARPDVTSGKLAVETTLSSGSEAKNVLSSASVSRDLSLSNGQSLHVVGYAYEVTAAGELTESATLRIGYDDEDIDNEAKLALYRWNNEDSSWDRLEALIDRQTNEAFTSISSFGVYAIGYSEFTEDEGGVDEAPRYTFELAQNYPNPYLTAGGETSINFTTSVDGSVKLSVYDLAGRLVNVLVDENLSAGHHTVSWNGSASNGVAAQSGVYFYKLESTEKNASRRMVLIR